MTNNLAALAHAAGVPLLTRLSVDPEISRLCDAGEIVAYDENVTTALAQALVEQVPARKPAPVEKIG